MALPAELEEKLREDFDIYDWDRPDSEYSKAPHRRQPFRAIIKDLVTDEAPLTEKIIKKMLRDLKRMRRVGVYPMDVHARNYKDGLLIDFSIAMTEPHYLFRIKPRWRVTSYKLGDLLEWQSLVKDEGVRTWERAVRNREYCKKLRSHGKSNQEPDD